MPKETLLKEYANLLIQELKLNTAFISKWKKFRDLDGEAEGEKDKQSSRTSSKKSDRSDSKYSQKRERTPEDYVSRYAQAIKQMWLADMYDPSEITTRERDQATRYLTSKLKRYSREQIDANVQAELKKDLQQGEHK
jgi:hypothetical protein